MFVASAALAWTSVAAALDPQPPELVSVRWDTGEPTEGVCVSARFSANNRFLSFSCFGNDIVPGDGNDNPDSFVLDRVTSEVERVSVTSDEQEVRYDSFAGLPSNDGDRVVFVGTGPLHPDFGPLPPFEVGRPTAYLRRRAVGLTELTSRDAFGQPLTSGIVLTDINFSRTEIVFSYPGDLFQGPDYDPNLSSQAWIRNWTTGALELVSRTPGGELSVGGAHLATLSATGRYVVFQSAADDLGPPARLGDENLYLRDRVTGAVERLTYPWQGGEFQAPFNAGPTSANASADGRYIVFETDHPEIHPDAPDDGGTYVYLLDRMTSELELLSPTPGYPSYNLHADISDDGRYVAWHSRNFSFNGPPNPPADLRAIWVLDRQTGQRVNVTAPLGPLYLDNNISMDLSPDGSMIAFTWRSGDPSSSIFARTLIYTAQLRGTLPSAPPAPVPVGLGSWLIALTVLMIGAGWARHTADVRKRKL